MEEKLITPESKQDESKIQDIQENKQTAQDVVKDQSSSEETPEQINWRKFREKREEERKEAERKIAEEKERAEKAAQEAKALKEAIDAILSTQGGATQNNGDYYGEESDSDRIAKLVQQELAKAEAERERQRAEREAKEWPHRLVRDVPDFDKVCTPENMDYLEYHHPEIADTVKDLPDGYNKWKKVYGLIKKYIPNSESRRDEQRLEKNMAKPRSASIPGLASTGDMAPSFLDDSRKKDNWSRMQKVLKGV